MPQVQNLRTLRSRNSNLAVDTSHIYADNILSVFASEGTRQHRLPHLSITTTATSKSPRFIQPQNPRNIMADKELFPVLVQLLVLCTSKSKDREQIDVTLDARELLSCRTSLRMWLSTLGTMNGIEPDDAIFQKDLSTMMVEIHTCLLNKMGTGHKRKITLPPMFTGIDPSLKDDGHRAGKDASPPVQVKTVEGGSEPQGAGGGAGVSSPKGKEKDGTLAEMACVGSEQPEAKDNDGTGGDEGNLSSDAPSTPPGNLRSSYSTRNKQYCGSHWGKLGTHWNEESDCIGQINQLNDGHFQIPCLKKSIPWLDIYRGENVTYSTGTDVSAEKRNEGIVMDITDDATYIKLYSVQKTTCELKVCPQTIEKMPCARGELGNCLSRHKLPLSIKQTYELVNAQVGRKVNWGKVSTEYENIHQESNPRSPKSPQKRGPSGISPTGKSFQVVLYRIDYLYDSHLLSSLSCCLWMTNRFWKKE